MTIQTCFKSDPEHKPPPTAYAGEGGLLGYFKSLAVCYFHCSICVGGSGAGVGLAGPSRIYCPAGF